MPSDIDFKIKDHGVQVLLKRIAFRLGSFKPGLELIGEIVHASIMKNFEKGGRPEWKTLSSVTTNIRKEKGKWPGQILVVSGALKRIIYKAGQDRVTFSANQKYAALQQFGAKQGSFGTFSVTQQVKEHVRKIGDKQQNVKAHQRKRKMKLPWGDIPARPFMMVQAEDWDEIKNELGDLLLK